MTHVRIKRISDIYICPCLEFLWFTAHIGKIDPCGVRVSARRQCGLYLGIISLFFSLYGLFVFSQKVTSQGSEILHGPPIQKNNRIPTPPKKIRKPPLISMGGQAEGQASADPGARNPIGVTENSYQVPIILILMWVENILPEMFFHTIWKANFR